MDRADLIAALAKMLAGLQVPLSIDSNLMLGAAAEPYRQILLDAPGFGWKTEEEFKEYLERVL